MTKMFVTKRFGWEMSHLLEGHNGLCKNNHGHSYHLDVSVEGPIQKNSSSRGMIIDFKDLKEIVNRCIVDKFDHAYVYNVNDGNSREIGALFEKKGMKTFKFLLRTTAENMATWMFREINLELRKKYKSSIKCKRIVLWETETSSVTVGKE
jgi:6-pyruvoyltetrahydropterin/6-carboxytetrahydropterin synthase